MNRTICFRVWVVIATCVLAAEVVQAGNPDADFFDGDPNARKKLFYDKDQGPNGTFYVYDKRAFGNPCFYKYQVPPGKVMQQVRFKRKKGELFKVYIVFVDGEGDRNFLIPGDFDKVCPSAQAQSVDYRRLPSNLQRSEPAAPATPTPTPHKIAVSNDADAFDDTCDGRFSVVVGANSATPVSLVNLETESEVDTFAFDGLSQSVAICDDNQTVLVQLDNTFNTAGQVRRLTINGGQLDDTMESLVLGSQFVFLKKVYAAPGSKTGIAMLQGGASQLISFSIPGLTMVDSVTTAVSTPNSLAFNCPGTKVYVRSGNRGINPDVIEVFGYNPATGIFTKPAALTIPGVSPYTGTIYPESIALTVDGAYVVASEANVIPGVPTPRLTLFDAVTGARADAITSDVVNPINVDIPACCFQRKTITSITRLANQHAKLEGTVESPNWTFTLQLAPNMMSTFGNPISITSDSNGMFQYDDAGAVGLDKRFYRLTYP